MFGLFTEWISSGYCQLKRQLIYEFLCRVGFPTVVKVLVDGTVLGWESGTPVVGGFLYTFGFPTVVEMIRWVDSEKGQLS